MQRDAGWSGPLCPAAVEKVATLGGSRLFLEWKPTASLPASPRRRGTNITCQLVPTPWATVRGFLGGLKWKWPELPRPVRGRGWCPAGQAGSEAAPVGLRGTRSQGAVTSWLKGQPRAGMRVGEEGRLEHVGVGGTQVRAPHGLTETETRPFDTKPPQHQCKPGGPPGCGSLQRLPPDHAPSVGPCFTTYGLQKSLCLSETQFPLLLSGVNCPLHLRLSLAGEGEWDYIIKWGDMDRCPRSWAGGVPED